MEPSLDDIVNSTQARIANQQGYVGPAGDDELEEDPELEGGEETDESDGDDSASSGSEWEYEDEEGESDAASTDDDVESYIATQVEQRVAAAISPLTNDIRALTQAFQQTQQRNQVPPEQEAQQQMQRIAQYLQSLPEDQREIATARITQAAINRVVQENQQMRQASAQQVQQQQQIEQHESVVQFIAAGGRWVPDPADPTKGEYKEGVAPKLTDEEITEMREYVRDDGWSMEKWANKTLKARGARKQRTKTIGKALTKREAATPRVKGRGNVTPQQQGGELTIDQIAQKAADQINQGMRTRR